MKKKIEGQTDFQMLLVGLFISNVRDLLQVAFRMGYEAHRRGLFEFQAIRNFQDLLEGKD